MQSFTLSVLGMFGWKSCCVVEPATTKLMNSLSTRKPASKKHWMKCCRFPTGILVRFGSIFVAARPRAAISSVAQGIGADLLVMGTVCRTGFTGFMIGNTAERVLTEVGCSVLTLKPSGFRSPITESDHEADSESYSTELP